MSKVKKVAENTNFTAVNIGSLNKLTEHTLAGPSGVVMEGKVFLKDITHSTGTEISYNVLPPQTAIPYFHTHKKNEETYLILSGSGLFQVDDKCFDITEGSVIRIAPNGKRGMTNTSNEPMIYIAIQSKENSLEEYSMGDGKMAADVKPMW